MTKAVQLLAGGMHRDSAPRSFPHSTSRSSYSLMAMHTLFPSLALHHNSRDEVGFHTGSTAAVTAKKTENMKHVNAVCSSSGTNHSTALKSDSPALLTQHASAVRHSHFLRT